MTRTCANEKALLVRVSNGEWWIIYNHQAPWNPDGWMTDALSATLSKKEAVEYFTKHFGEPVT
jgi:hypothetical protein